MLSIGSTIPALIGTDHNGNEVALAQFIGKPLAIYFYPKDDTPGCTAQACSIRDGETAFAAHGITVLGVSADSPAAHQKFITKYTLPFTLIADVNREIIEAFGVWGPKKFMGRTYDGIHRTTFLFNKEGVLIHKIEKPDTKNHAEEILKIFDKNK
jgi:peroxiredoxin Q/BCP